MVKLACFRKVLTNQDLPLLQGRGILAAPFLEQIADASTYKFARAVVCATYGTECERRRVVALLFDTLTDLMTREQIAEAQSIARGLWGGRRLESDR